MPQEALGRLAVRKLPTSQNPPHLDPLALKKKTKIVRLRQGSRSGSPRWDTKCNAISQCLISRRPSGGAHFKAARRQRRRSGPVPGKFLGIVGQHPSDSKSNQLHVDIFRFCFHLFEVCSIDSSKRIDNFPLGLQLVISQTQPVHLQWTAGSPGHRYGPSLTH